MRRASTTDHFDNVMRTTSAIYQRKKKKRKKKVRLLLENSSRMICHSNPFLRPLTEMPPFVKGL